MTASLSLFSQRRRFDNCAEERETVFAAVGVGNRFVTCEMPLPSIPSLLLPSPQAVLFDEISPPPLVG